MEEAEKKIPVSNWWRLTTSLDSAGVATRTAKSIMITIFMVMEDGGWNSRYVLRIAWLKFWWDCYFEEEGASIRGNKMLPKIDGTR